MLRHSLAACVLLFACCGSSPAVEWNAFRGPDGNGHAAVHGLPITWSETQNVIWRQAVPGLGWSSPVVHNGTIYITAAVPSTAAASELSLRLLSFNGTTGELTNNVEIFQQRDAKVPRIHSKNSHASPTPLIQGNRIYVHFGHQGTACLDTKGKILWRNRSLAYRPVHGNGGSPILVGDALIFSCDGGSDPFIVALDAETGEVRWKTDRETDASKKFSFSTPILITVAGQQQVISPGSNVVCAFNPIDGKEIWRLRYDGYSIIPKPVFAHGLVFVCTGYNRPSLLAIRPDGVGDVTATHLVWETNRSVPHTSSVLVIENELFMVADNGVASCLDARTGAVHWSERVRGQFSASPLYANGLIYLQDEDGTATVLKASTEYEVVTTNAIGERTLASYGVIGKALLVRSDKHLYRIESR
jgi:outer membrane protein assembly factor BamB